MGTLSHAVVFALLFSLYCRHGIYCHWMDEDFESVGNESTVFSSSTWFDNSNGDMKWMVEETSPIEGSTRHLRLNRSTTAFNVAVLKSAAFTAQPGDRITFDYWIQSEHPQFTNLQLCWAATNDKEKLLIDLYKNANADCQEWKTISESIPVESPVEITLTFYGFCGMGNPDAIALDNIAILTSSTTSTSRTSTKQSTLTTTTTASLNSNSDTTTDIIRTGDAVTSTSTESTIEACLQDYSPCRHSQDIANYCQVICEGLSADVVQDVFRRVAGTAVVELDLFELTIISNPEGEEIIPANLLSKTRSESIWLLCPSNNDLILIDPDGFSFTKDYTTILTITKCDLSLLRFEFLTYFDRLQNLVIRNARNLYQTNFVQIPTPLPSSSLNSITITECPDVNKLTGFPSVPLAEVALSSNNLYDDDMSSILDSLLMPTRDTLTSLDLAINRLSFVPTQIVQFTRLQQVYLDQNKIINIPAGAFNFPTGVNFSLNFGEISIVEPGAFEGDFSGATYVSISSNQLTRLEEFAFGSLLQQLIDGGLGTRINLIGNPIDCQNDTCHLSWLVRDQRHLLLYAIEPNVACSNRTLLIDLDYENGFNHCSLDVTA